MHRALFGIVVCVNLASACPGAVTGAYADDVAISACGTVVPPGARGVLQADLDCTSAPASEPAVVLGHHASLSLEGFTLTGAAGGTAVRCARHCTVAGPGTITSAAPPAPGILRADCIRARVDTGEKPRRQKLTIENLTLDGCGSGVIGDTGRLGAKLMVNDVVATNNDGSFIGANIRARSVTASNGTGAGFLAPTGKVTGTDIHADGNDPVGIDAARVSLADSTAIGNTAFGVLSQVGPAKLVRTTVTGSDLRDVVSAKPPQVDALTCETSARWIAPNGIGAPWGVCTGD
jgi:hypothetical protein